MPQRYRGLIAGHAKPVAMMAMAAANALGAVPEVHIPDVPFSTCAGRLASSYGAAGDLSDTSVLATDLLEGRTFVYRSAFHATRWSGSLKRYELILDVAGKPSMAKMADWDAADMLTIANQHAHGANADNRKIYTSISVNGKSLSTIELKWDQLSTEQRTAFNASPVNGKKDGLGQKRLDYLRGQRTLEQGNIGGIFRKRDSVLGDIVNSHSVYAGAPVSNAEEPGHRKFYDENKNRESAVYVGANDGMLHAFDAKTGKELFAYVPNVLVSDLTQLTRPDYAHRPYVDGSPVVSDAIAKGTWKTILASGFGGGAQGVFALDVTNPADFGNGAGVMWEFTDADDPDIGNQMAAPVIAKFKVRTEKGISRYQYFVVVSSGLNNYKPDGKGKYDASGKAALFLLSLDKTPSEKWKRNVNYFKFSTPIRNTGQENGLSSPAVAVDRNGAVRYVYAGDLQGNVWRFDFTGDAPWSRALSSDTPIFTATDAEGNTQPITIQPKVVFAPGGGYVVLFGTGKLIEESDTVASNFKTQSFYGVYDTTKNGYAIRNRARLVQRILIDKYPGMQTIAGSDFVYGTTQGASQGWYFDFSNSDHTGERSLTNAVVYSGKLFFNTLLPSVRQCGESSGRSYVLDALTGLPSGDATASTLSQIGILGMPVILHIQPRPEQRVSSTIDGKDQKRDIVINLGSGGSMGTVSESGKGTDALSHAAARSGSFGWREIVNWQELHDAASSN